MTEAEWLSATEPTPMLVYLRGGCVPDSDELVPSEGPAVRCSERKIVLFVVAVCERIRNSRLNNPSRQGITCLQAYSAEAISLPALLRSLEEYRRSDERGTFYPFYNATVTEPQAAHFIAIKAAVVTAWTLAHEALHRIDPDEIERLGDNWKQHKQSEGEWRQAYQRIEMSQAHLLREIEGNPFHPAVLDPDWLTLDVLALAEGIYEDLAFDRMPILADALQDAGCDNADILNHCRQPGEHVRGCWVIDLLTGRK